MNDYDLLGLMDTHKQMKAQGIDVPDTFAEFLTGIQPINDGESVEVPQVGQGSSSYEEAINDVKQRERTADVLTNELGVGDPIIQIPGKTHKGSQGIEQFIPFNTKPTAENQEAFEHGKRLRVRQELGYDIK